VDNLSPFLSCAATFLLIRWMLSSERLRLALDHPNPRSLHAAPLPRTGGLAIVAGVLVSFMPLFPEAALAFMCALTLAAVSFLDDWRGLPVAARFLAHIAVAAVFVAVALPERHLFAQAGFMLAIVWMVNLYNFMDGSDGLAGGMALFGFGAFAMTAYFAGDATLALMAASVAAAALAFLWFNFHPARIFMGDSGSIPLGFLAAGLGLIGWERGLWPLWFPVLVFSPFVVDATVTLAKRAARGEKVWRAHCEHYYQRLVRMGFGHRNTALLEYVIMLGAGASAIAARKADLMAQIALLAGWSGLYAFLMFLVDRRWEKHANDWQKTL
jgi:UDP-N-acetylmuramyl pentapeptide phosphotransferase/UDP-N-acetylglucosamine-1-phosphate transferase